MRRTLALLPSVVVGLALAFSSSPLDASASDSEAAAPRLPTKRWAQRGEVLPVHANLAAAGRVHPFHAVLEGSLPVPHDRAACRDGMANIGGRFCIDRWEASLVEVRADGGEQSWPYFQALGASGSEPHALRAVSRPNVYPQAYISGAQAAKACAASGKRLCAPIEWRKACMGPDEKKFGYGSERVSGRCNDSGRSPMLRIFPQVVQSWHKVGFAEMNDPRLNQLEGTLATTGSHEECTNDYGVYDMVGNLHEWTSDPNGTFQGGYYLDTHLNGDGCTYRTTAHEFAYHDYSTGFRCCGDVQNGDDTQNATAQE